MLHPDTYLWMHDQELKRTMRQNALLRAARAADKPAARQRSNLLRNGLAALRRTLRPAATGSA